MTKRAVEYLAQIKLTLASVDKFVSIARGLADDNPVVSADLHLAADSARSSAELVDHLRTLFSNQRQVDAAVAQQRHQQLIVTSNNNNNNNNNCNVNNQMQPTTTAAATTTTSVALQATNAHFFERANVVKLALVAKCLVAAVAKILYLADSVVLNCMINYANNQQQQQQFDASKCRLDNVANYGELLRAFAELSDELVDLGACLAFAACSSPSGKQPLLPSNNNSNSSNNANCQQQTLATQIKLCASVEVCRANCLRNAFSKQHKIGDSTLTAAELEAEAKAEAATTTTTATAASDFATANLVSEQRCRRSTSSSAQLDAQVRDFQTLFAANRLVIERKIIVLLNAAKCSQRHANCEHALNACASIARQVRAAVSIIMAVVKHLVFAQCNDLQAVNSNSNNDDHVNCKLNNELAVDERSCSIGCCCCCSKQLTQNADNKNNDDDNECDNRQQKQRLPRALLDYFLHSASATTSALDAICELQNLVVNQSINASNNNRSTSPTLLSSLLPMHKTQTCFNALKNNNNNNKENLLLLSSSSSSSLSLSKQHLFNSKQTLRQTFNEQQALCELSEQVCEFTDCPNTTNERRENILSLVGCIKLLLTRLVKLNAKLSQWLTFDDNDLLVTQQKLIDQIDETCEELKIELQAVVVEQSDEFDRASVRADLLARIKHCSFVGDENKFETISVLFTEQIQQLLDICKMLNEVSSTNKMKIKTRLLTIWFESNCEQLLNVAHCLCLNPHSRVAKACLKSYAQIWTSFYDDFCQLARQIAYQSHSNFDAERNARVSLLRAKFEREINYNQSDEFCLNVNQVLSSSMLQTNNNNNINVNDNENNNNHDDNNNNNNDDDNDADLELLALMSPQIALSHSLRRGLHPLSVAHSAGFNRQATHQTLAYNQRLPHSAPCDGSGFIHSAPARVSMSPIRGLSRGEESSALLQSQSLIYEQQQQQQAMGVAQPTASSLMQQARVLTQLPPVNNSEQLSGVVEKRTTRRPPPLNIKQHHQQHYHQQQQHQEDNSNNLIGAMHLKHKPLNTSSTGSNRKITQFNMSACQSYNYKQEDEEEDEEGDDDQEEEDVEGNVGNQRKVNKERVDNSEKWLINNENANDESTQNNNDDDSETDLIVRCAREIAQMANSMYEFTRGEGDLNTTQDLFTQAELVADNANELYKEVRCFSYKVPGGSLKRQLLLQLDIIPTLVQQLQFSVKNPTVGKPATFTKVDNIISETKALVDVVEKVVVAAMSCRQHYNMASESMRKRSRMLSPSIRGGFESNEHQVTGRLTNARGYSSSVGSEPDI